MKNSFVVVPAPLYLRFNGRLEYETSDTKRHDERKPLFVKFELGGAKGGLFSKVKKKSVFYKVTNIEIPLVLAPGQQQNHVRRKPMPHSQRMCLDESPISSKPKADEEITSMKWNAVKPSDVTVESPVQSAAVSPSSLSSYNGRGTLSSKTQPQPDRYGINSADALSIAELVTDVSRYRVFMFVLSLTKL